ncbi:glycine dehydrogenase subunit 2 [Rhodobium orientis]|uniref:glycine dehydrogenase (aminomethyl-transferring) n=1 Tax=Rhodobium orientis TaxID=34017 RepID=A0A327JE36_9HYPH|nr:aminomethyl-transferring glycine dehydrogenase subunit GcvPB [Rhodobium orientis]MBB4304239.1 glycine dehydrogenase subunit 2 [Rhodobium orientis]MBK5950708.1 glycine dehydrogenase (aminomethyl-transferring) [Rhodobium orientis]RAI23995.1 glycine dehydrogenase (aminomethyl-transferring) [Rhodobium orientis]
MTMNREGRPTTPDEVGSTAPDTFTGNRALRIEEPVIFDVGTAEATGVDLPEPDGAVKSRLGGLERSEPLDLPGLAEPEAMRHYVRLSQKNYAIDMGLYPLGSCTMKHNPRLNEKMARLPGFADVHPLQPVSTVPGALELIAECARWLCVSTGMEAVAMSPKAGAHGELCGMMAIKAAHAAHGENRSIVLVPESAHGTNPATAALLGYKVVAIPAREDGTVDPAAVIERLSDDVAGIMLTNPNTCGLFERDIVEIAKAVHEAGAYFYCDGANLNAILGKARPGDLGVDCMHINLHKTFSTPHGGGGPGAGPVVLSERLKAFAPLPYVKMTAAGPELIETPADAEADGTKPFGRMTAFHGQMGMFVRAMTYMLSHGADGLRQASEDAVLNANYVRAGLQDVMSLPFGERPYMHEVLFDDSFLDDTGVSTLDFAKAMIDEGFHPMTMYFPLVVHGAMLIEPTESESKASLDLFVATLRDLVMRAKRGEVDRFKGAPWYAPRRRLDETAAARHPVLKWTPPEPQTADAAE